VVVVLAAAAVGGARGGGVDTGGTGAVALSYAAGRISGFGSVIVNDVHYDDTTAAILDDDGGVHVPDDLQLGMTVTIESGPVTQDADGTTTSVASKITFGSEIIGPVEATDTATSTLQVLGQTVKLDVNTVLAGYASPAAIRTGDVVQVFAFFDSSGSRYAATRVEHLPEVPSRYKVRGPIAHLDTAAKTFDIGAATIDYGSVAPADLPGLQDGATARVELRTQMQGGRWIATRIVTGLPGIPPDTTIEIEGFVTAFRSLARFKVDGVDVDASGSGVVFDQGTAAQIANRARLLVRGHLHDEVLIAEHIQVTQVAPSAGNDDNPPQEPQQFEVKGSIASVDAPAQSFVVRGTTVFYDGNTEFDRGDVSDLQPGRTVQVKGTLTNGNELHAERIKFFK
jgi:hypothetical protein